MGSFRTGRRWAARRPLVAAYVVLAAVALTLLLWSDLAADEQDALPRCARPVRLRLLVVGGALLLAGLVALVARLVGRYTTAARRLSAETRLLLDANPDHLVDRSGPPELAELAAAVDALAERASPGRTRGRHPDRHGTGWASSRSEIGWPR